MENITIKINGIEVSAPAGSTILEAARLAHIKIPTLCYLRRSTRSAPAVYAWWRLKAQKALWHPAFIRSMRVWRCGPIPRRFWNPEKDVTASFI